MGRVELLNRAKKINTRWPMAVPLTVFCTPPFTDLIGPIFVPQEMIYGHTIFANAV